VFSYRKKFKDLLTELVFKVTDFSRENDGFSAHKMQKNNDL